MKSEKSEIEYFKKNFLSQFKFDKIISENKEKNSIKELFKNYSTIYAQIINCDSKYELKKQLNQLDNLFYNIEIEHLENSGDIQPTGICYELLYLRKESPLKNIDDWFNKTEKKFQSIKQENKFFKFLSTVAKLSPKPYLENLSSNIDVIKLSQQIIKKYNLSHISLENCKSSKQAIGFLKKFDKETNKVVNDMKILPYCIGIYQTNSIMYINEKKFNAGYQSQTKCLIFHNVGLNKRSILHEWIHSIDNYVCEKYTNENKFTTEMSDKLFLHNNTPISTAYHTIRELTQKLFNQDHKQVKEYINKAKKDYLSIFWYKFSHDTSAFESDILSRNMSNKDLLLKNYLLSPDNQKKLMNYIIEPANQEYISNITNILIEKIGYSKEEAQKTLEKYYDFTLNLKEKLTIINSNFFDNPSKYFYNSSSFSILDFWQGIPSQYYSQPYEMMARYFESQVYNTSTMIEDLTSVTSRYTTKDKDFDDIKNKIINNIFPNQILNIVDNLTFSPSLKR